MTWQRSIQAAVRALRSEEKLLARQLDAIRGKITDLEALGREGSGAGTAPRRKAGRRRLSAEGRAAISKAAKKRWAKYRAEQRSKRR